jgi:hypothetical protein
VRKTTSNLLILPFLSAFIAIGQTTKSAERSDFALWTVIGISPKPVAGRWSSFCGFEYRLKENMNATDLYCGIVNVGYIINDKLQVGLGYEIFLNNCPERYITEHRYYPQAAYSIPLGRLSVTFRSQVMNTFTEWQHPYFEHRNRLKINYSLKETSLKPFIYIEPYSQLEKPSYRINKIRYAVGCSYKFIKQQVDLYYMWEDYHDKLFIRHVANVNYTYLL